MAAANSKHFLSVNCMPSTMLSKWTSAPNPCNSPKRVNKELSKESFAILSMKISTI